MFGNFFGGHPAPLGRFEATYRCFPVSFIGKADAERGDKIFLPPSALDRLGTLLGGRFRRLAYVEFKKRFCDIKIADFESIEYLLECVVFGLHCA